jgi:hypothetical protein
MTADQTVEHAGNKLVTGAAQPPPRGPAEGVRGGRREDPQTASTPSPSSPQLGARPKAKKRKKKTAGPTPWIVVGAALAAGIVLAKWIDWKGHV